MGTVAGTTSAYAENTPSGPTPQRENWNYLRVRGEYLRLIFKDNLNRELPPRTRRIRTCQFQMLMEHGTTSAYAENTLNELGLL